MDRVIAERAGLLLAAIKKVDRRARENLLLVDAVVVLGVLRAATRSTRATWMTSSGSASRAGST